jgi:hypothetical protein
VKRVSLLALGLLFVTGSSAAAAHKKSARRAHRTTVAQAKTDNPRVEIGGDPTDPIGGLGHVPHKKRKH